MIRKVLIATRGEIALRIIRSCREMGIRTVAVCSTADRNALHVRLADESVCIGPPPIAESYLNVPRLLGAAETSGADAIHPGYGLLSESAAFAEVCGKCGVTFIGPTLRNLRLMGNKGKAREVVSRAGIPVLPGVPRKISDAREALRAAQRIGFPVLIKAASGVGGRGLKLVLEPSRFVEAYEEAKGDVRAAFGDEHLIVERYCADARHVEFQILADSEGRAIHLGERECTVQRRFEKVLEESPCGVLGPALRAEMGEAAIQAAAAVNYRTVGTVEFLVDGRGRYFFIEMSARIQAEHPVTEMVTGVDIVKEQIRLAAGLPLDMHQEDLRMRGHAIEARIYGEDPVTFERSYGTVARYHPPGGSGVRVESALQVGDSISTHSDPLLAKVIVHAESRPAAIAKMRVALREMVLDGLPTNLELHRRIFADAEFVDGRVTSGFLARFGASN